MVETHQRGRSSSSRHTDSELPQDGRVSACWFHTTRSTRIPTNPEHTHKGGLDWKSPPQLKVPDSSFLQELKGSCGVVRVFSVSTQFQKDFHDCTTSPDPGSQHQVSHTFFWDSITNHNEEKQISIKSNMTCEIKQSTDQKCPAHTPREVPEPLDRTTPSTNQTLVPVVETHTLPQNDVGKTSHNNNNTILVNQNYS